MQFPTFQVPYLGNGMIIGLNAVVHVLISHGIPLGAFVMLTLADWHDWRLGHDGDAWKRFNKRLLRFIVLTTTIAGAVTGAGIWFTTTALASPAIGSMLRIFFWPWFMEWIAFVAEVVGLLILYFLWDILEERRQLRIGLEVAYLVVTVLSAILITGILGFMLTPGGWLANGRFSSAFFNPSFLPQLFSRLALALSVGCLIAIAFASFSHLDEGFRREAMRLFGPALLGALVLFVCSVTWYYLTIPSAFATYSDFAVLTSRLSQSPWLLYVGNGIALGILVLLAILAWRRHTLAARRLSLPALLLFAGMVAEFERVREFIRGPYVMPWYMYANGVLLEEGPLLQHEGALAASPWNAVLVKPGDVRSAGAQLFARQCSACHTLDGVNSIRDRIRGRTEDGLFVIIGRTQQMVPFMPRFSGTREERRILARFLQDLGEGRVEMLSRSRHIVAPGANGP